MNSGQFANYAMSHGCTILPPGTARLIRLYNPKTNGKFNLGIYDNVYPETIRRGCIRLTIPFPDDLPTE